MHRLYKSKKVIHLPCIKLKKKKRRKFVVEVKYVQSIKARKQTNMQERRGLTQTRPDRSLRSRSRRCRRWSRGFKKERKRKNVKENKSVEARNRWCAHKADKCVRLDSIMPYEAYTPNHILSLTRHRLLDLFI